MKGAFGEKDLLIPVNLKIKLIFDVTRSCPKGYIASKAIEMLVAMTHVICGSIYQFHMTYTEVIP
jgi:hypothetical protein